MIDRTSAEARARMHLLASSAVKQRLAAGSLREIVHAAALVASTLKAGGKVMLCGNGGSAADCQHIAAEFTNRLRSDHERPALAALALTTDTSFLTAHANDYAFATVFQRQVEALGRSGDVLIAISTSGNSTNLLRAVEACRARHILTIGLLGGRGGLLAEQVHLRVLVPSGSTQHIQEAHITLGHILVDLVEQALQESELEQVGGETPDTNWGDHLLAATNEIDR